MASQQLPPAVAPSSYPLQDVPQPHPHDVLCGRGGGTNNHIGNSHWRMLVAANKQLYITLPKRQKMLLSRSIVNAVRSQSPPGRFLQKDSKSNLWFDVGDQRAQEKTSQALREGAPDIRSKLAAQKKGGDVDDGTEATGDDNNDNDEEERESETPPKELRQQQSSSSTTSSYNNRSTPVVSSGASTASVHAPAIPSQANLDYSVATPQNMRQPTSDTSNSNSNSNSGYLQMQHAMQHLQQQQQQQQSGQAQQQPLQNQQHQHEAMFMNSMGGQQQPHHPHHQHQQQQQPQMQFMTSSNGLPQAGSVVNTGNNQMMYYGGPNTTPVPVYPTMVLNDQGQMVAAMSVVPPMMPSIMPSMVHTQQNTLNDTKPTPLQSSESASSVATPKQQSNLSHSPNPTKPTAQNMQQQLQQLYHQKNRSQPGHVINAPINLPTTFNNYNGGGSAGNSQRQHANPNNPNISFDDYVAMLPPDALEPAGLSFGSVVMTDVEHRKLEAGGQSIGSTMSYKPLNFGSGGGGVSDHQVRQQQQQQMQQYQQQMQMQQQMQQILATNHAPHSNNANHTNDTNKQHHPLDIVAPDALAGLEPTGISFGDMSMMSIGTNKKLENTGTSFGSMMSYITTRAPDIVDGGLDAIGTSFGDLSIDTSSKEKLFQSLELAAAGPEVPPMFPETQAKSTANLLDCSDTESETSQDKEVLQAQKSQAWEKLQEKFARSTQKSTTSEAGSRELMPPPPPGGVSRPMGGNDFAISGMLPAQLSIPATNFNRDYSQISAFSVGDHDDDDGINQRYPGEVHEDDDDAEAAAMPPPPITKNDDEGEQLEMYYLQRGNSLGEEFLGNQASV